MTVWLLDSNAVMGYLNQDSAPGFINQFEQALVEGAAVSVITTIEVLGWRGHDQASRASAEKLLGCMDEIPLATSVVQQTNIPSYPLFDQASRCSYRGNSLDSRLDIDDPQSG